MAAALHSLLVVQLDRQIAEMERRQIEAARKAWPPGATLQHGYSPTHETIAEDLKKQISGLRRKRERLAAGLDVDEPATEKQASVAPPTYKPPRRITTKEQRERARKEARPEDSLPPMSARDQAAFNVLDDLFDPVIMLANFENFLAQNLTDKDISQHNRPVSLTQCHWTALIVKMATIEAVMRRSFYFNRKKRTELEDRVTQLDTSIRTTTSDVSAIRAEWQASGSQTKTKTIKTRRDASGQLVADVFEGDGEKLERRITALEAVPHLKYRGVWNANNQYNEADLATHDGSVFYCKRSTRDKPGTSDNWQLMVKRGRDAKTR